MDLPRQADMSKINFDHFGIFFEFLDLDILFLENHTFEIKNENQLSPTKLEIFLLIIYMLSEGLSASSFFICFRKQ